MEIISQHTKYLQKLGITSLNKMQESSIKTISAKKEVMLISPTGSGKTIAFLLPLLDLLSPDIPGIQCLILCPSRELAIQTEQVLRKMGTGFKVNCFYGGRAMAKDKIDLNTPPSILVGTPGRIAHHFRKGSFATKSIHFLVLDEFDKSLEIGFEEDMQFIMGGLFQLQKKVLTSATQSMVLPRFLGLKNPSYLTFENEQKSKLQIKRVMSPEKDKRNTLYKTLCQLGSETGIVFCNYRESINFVSEFLAEHGIDHGCFHGGLEQLERETNLIKFRNGTYKILLATDLAARGIDVPEMDYIIHYHLPLKSDEFVHRNGRTARMHSEGKAIVLQWDQEVLPEFISGPTTMELKDSPPLPPSMWCTLLISGGRKDKVSKGDIAGLFFKKGLLKQDQLGLIELQRDCAFISVQKNTLKELIPLVDGQRIKKKKVKIRKI